MAKPLRLLLVGLLNVMLLLTPIVAQAMSGEAGCLPVATGAVQVEQTQMHHSDHASQHHAEGETSPDRAADMAACCAQGCLIDLSLSMTGAAAIPAMTDVPAAWMLTNLSDLTGPSGLRRPPRG